MAFQFQQAFRAVVLFAFFAFLIKIHVSGEILQYVNPKYNFLSQTAACLFFFLFCVQCTRVWTPEQKHNEHCHHGCSHGPHHSQLSLRKGVSYFILIFPLVTGFLLPPKTLDAAAASKKGIVLGSGSAGEPAGNEPEASLLPEEQTQISIVEEEVAVERKEIKKDEYEKQMKQLDHSSVIELKDHVFEPYFGQINEEPEKYLGKTIKMKGFVYKEEGFESNQLVLTRFLITHCIADASSIGFLTEFNEADTLEQDTWLEVEGTLQMTVYDGSKMPVLKITSWNKIKEPKEPYIYPVYIKIM